VPCFPLEAGTAVADGLGRPGHVRRVRVDGQAGPGTFVLFGGGLEVGLGVFCGGLLLESGWHWE
jgi:hypothetical protein